MGGREQERHVGPEGSGLGEDLEAVHAGHLVVEQHQVEVLGADHVEGGLAAVGALH